MTEPDFAMGTSLVAGTAREAEGRRPNSAPAASNNPNILPVGGRCMYARAVCALAYILRAEERLRTRYRESSAAEKTHRLTGALVDGVRRPGSRCRGSRGDQRA